MGQREDIIRIAIELCANRYAGAGAVLAAGSLIRGEGTAHSDLDLVVVFPRVACAYRGTTAVWDDDHLVFANIRSPGTLANLRQNANVEVNVVDPFLRKAYRFKGVASVFESRALYDTAIAFYEARGSRVSAFREVVLVRLQNAQPIDSPAYDFGLTEDELRDRWERYFQSLRAGKVSSPAGE